MLRIPNLKETVEVDHPFTFPLDPFQKHAIAAIAKDENVLVTAKTGSGKTLVGEFQIHHSLKKGKRVFYTTPIKSLSNQKFHDLKEMFPSVGIMTGDIQFCPHADVVILTTEILRNLLFKQGTSTEHVGVTAGLSIENLDAVVFDEVHYINDPDRGNVWEECLTLLPPHINLVLLSATIEKPERFAHWLGECKQKPIHLISTEYRVVPLVHTLPDKSVVMDAKGSFSRQAYLSFYNKFYAMQKEEQLHKERVTFREDGQIVKRGEHTSSFVDRMNKFIENADLPALFFVFSRKNCVEFANKVSAQLIDASDSASVRHIIAFHLHRYPYLQTNAQYHELHTLLQKGVAYHHSGLLPILKEIVEILFAKGFIKVLFATETFAVGINMPTKTVVFTSYRKTTDDRKRMLTTSEYTQMAGRAGRRGKDDKGIVVYLPIWHPESVLEVETMMTGKQSELVSRLDFGYEYVLSCIQSGKTVHQQSYWMTERHQDLQSLRDRIYEKQIMLVDFDGITHADLQKRYEIEQSPPSKQQQSELSQWKNRHMHPKWDVMYKQFKQNQIIRNEIEFLRESILLLSDTDTDIRPRKDVLRAHGYLDGETLTQKGILASEIHEGHALLMSHAFYEKMLHECSADDLVACLSVFLEEPVIDEPIARIAFHEQLMDVAKTIVASETLKSDYAYWKLTSYWNEPVIEWLSGNDFVCEQYGLEYGNFVRAMLKLANLVDEWVSLATIMQDVEMIEKLVGMRSRIVRGCVVPDSLYLRL